ncbi:universal stress protein [Paraburkholderia solisilvae]|uniref:Universal stress protein n=1 Tax=Paraburkholderia solisilvae TaxID=624376 RepID=A0A6J5DD10_9BURK|nr:universal stress protein [Paraburkholderia solisilvae]CAB3751171.1 Putative universal stress protein [Paraburkholderia solisilvae]
MYSSILVALDGSETSHQALDVALRLARENQALLHPLYVIDMPGIAFGTPGFNPVPLRDALRDDGERVIADARDRMATLRINGNPRIVDTSAPSEDIAQRIQLSALECHADLIVMGTHGRRGFRRLVLGSVAERVVRDAPCPVLLIPAGALLPDGGDTASSPAEKERS